MHIVAHGEVVEEARSPLTSTTPAVDVVVVPVVAAAFAAAALADEALVLYVSSSPNTNRPIVGLRQR